MVGSCFRAASTTVVSPLRIDMTRAARRLAVHRWMSSGSPLPCPFLVSVSLIVPPMPAVETAELAPLAPPFPQPRRRPHLIIADVVWVARPERGAGYEYPIKPQRSECDVHIEHNVRNEISVCIRPTLLVFGALRGRHPLRSVTPRSVLSFQ